VERGGRCWAHSWLPGLDKDLRLRTTNQRRRRWDLTPARELFPANQFPSYYHPGLRVLRFSKTKINTSLWARLQIPWSHSLAPYLNTAACTC
jgi:hypothetical protein